MLVLKLQHEVAKVKYTLMRSRERHQGPLFALFNHVRAWGTVLGTVLLNDRSDITLAQL